MVWESGLGVRAGPSVWGGYKEAKDSLLLSSRNVWFRRGAAIHRQNENGQGTLWVLS